MDSIRPNQPRRYRSREPLDRRFDQWMATGRQFVDGVAGNRPGKRRPFNTSRFSSSSFESVGRWVGDKLDWLLEEEDGWLEPWESESKVNYSSKKRPLEAVSRRVSQAKQVPNLENQEVLNEEDWPDESTFRVDKWQRRQSENSLNSGLSTTSSKSLRSDRRPIPRSSRRRD